MKRKVINENGRQKAFIGAAIKGHSILGPSFFLGLGIYLLNLANKKKLEKKDKDKWNNHSSE